MVDLGGGGQRPPPESQAFDRENSLPAVVHGGRSLGDSRCLSRGPDGRFLSVSKESQMNVDIHPAEVITPSSLMGDDEFQDNFHAEIEAVSGVGNADVQMLGNNLHKGVSPLLADCVNNNAMDSLPPLPPEFCFGSSSFQRTHQSCPVASRTRPQGVRVMSSAIPKQPVSEGLAAGASHIPNRGPSNAWSRPKVIPIPSVAELGQFSCDGTTANLDDVEVAVTMKKFDSAIVGRMFGKKIPYSRLSSELQLRWAGYGGFRLVTMSSDCFVCFFDTVEARDAILLGGPWVILGQVLGIDRWTPSFSPSSSIGFCTPVWVRLPCLPFYCWSSRNIGRIMALIGEPLWLDAATEHLERGFYARACVRLDLSKPLKSGIWVNGCHGKFFQALEYEGLSIFCYRCGHVGHKSSSCSLKMPSGGIQPASKPSSLAPGSVQQQVGMLHDNIAQNINVAADGSTDPSSTVCNVVGTFEDDASCRGVGPWMMVTRKKRPSNKSVSHPSATALAAPNFKNKTHSMPLNADVEISHGAMAKQKSFSHPSRASSQLGNSNIPHEDAINSHMIASQLSVDNGKAASDLHGENQFLFSGFSAQPSASKQRPSKPFMDKLLTDLGPIAVGTRKKRKQHIFSDGGDASSLKPP